jgi:hypothetical protein
MSGLLVFFACFAIAIAIAVPTVARATSSPSKPPAVTRVAAAVDMFLKLDGLIEFQKADGSLYKELKLTDAECLKLVVVAHKGNDFTGPIVAQTNAMLGKDPSTCVYSLKVPSGQNLTIGVQSFSWGESKLSSQEFLKLSPADKWVPTVKLADGSYQKHAIKGESPSFFKWDYKEHKGATAENMPLFVKLSF